MTWSILSMCEEAAELLAWWQVAMVFVGSIVMASLVDIHENRPAPLPAAD